MTAQFIFTMRDLRRFHPPDREVLKGINISMFPGAKIGVLGANGAGKSSLLRIMAGDDDGYTGEARLTPGFSVGFLPQEPELDAAKDVLGNVTDGVAEVRSLLDRYEQVCAAMGDADADFDKLLAEQGELQDRIDAAGAWDLDRTLDIAMDALRLSPRARQAKGKARVNAYESLLSEAQSAPDRADKLEMTIPVGARLGDVVVEATDLVKGYGNRLLIDALSFSLPPGGIVGVIGPNGAGKTTLFR